MCRHYGWRHDFWRAPGTDGRVMGWRELRAWIAAMNRDHQPARTEPDTWAGADHDANWLLLHAARDRLRGR